MSKYFFFIILFSFLISCKQTNEQLFDNALELGKEKKYDKAIEIYSSLIKHNKKLQLPYYNRGLCYIYTKNYSNALADFNKVMSLQSFDGFISILNKDSPFADEEAKSQVPYYDALYQRAQVKFYMDSINSSFKDFQILINNDYEGKSNCLLWQGTLWIRGGKQDSACEYFQKAKQLALTEDDKQEANKMIKSYCEKKNQ